MSKYSPLRAHLVLSKGNVDLRFTDLEELLGFSLPRSARRHAAWWSNSGGSHVQSAAWLDVGYRTENVNLAQETVRFVPDPVGGFGEMKQPPLKSHDDQQQVAVEEAGKTQARHPLFGIWKGLVTLDPDYDYTLPADPDWGKVYED